MTKIDVISGFLGAGKTTLIKKLLDEGLKDEKLVLIENEFGEIGIDGGFLKDSGINITEMNSGCICCSLKGDFSEALKKVIAEYNPDRIIIEPSGVGKLSDVLSAVKTVVNDEIVLNSFSTVADANRFKIYHKNFGEFFDNQIETAQVVILSHTQNVSEAKMETSIEIIKELNPRALISTTDWNEITGEQLLFAIENGSKSFAESLINDDDEEEHHHHEHDEHCKCVCHDHDHEYEHHHHADDVFVSWGIQTASKFTKKQLNSILNDLIDSSKYGTILRAKGIVAGNDGQWIHFDYVPGELEIRNGSADITGRICVIGSQINEQALTELFK